MNRRFVVDLHNVSSDNDIIGHQFPLQSFKTDSKAKLIAELTILLDNSISGINKIVVFDNAFDQSPLTMAGQAIQDLDEDR